MLLESQTTGCPKKERRQMHRTGIDWTEVVVAKRDELLDMLRPWDPNGRNARWRPPFDSVQLVSKVWFMVGITLVDDS